MNMGVTLRSMNEQCVHVVVIACICGCNYLYVCVWVPVCASVIEYLGKYACLFG